MKVVRPIALILKIKNLKQGFLGFSTEVELEET